jgi:hypothetical protein
LATALQVLRRGSAEVIFIVEIWRREVSDRIPGMRKSEALARIKRLLNEWVLRQPQETTDTYAELILQEAVENIWGRPPSRNADSRSSYGYATVYDWEPELDSSRKSGD